MTRQTRRWLLPGCGLLLVLVVGALIVSAPAAMALRLAGFRAQGKTADYIDEQAGVSRPTIAWSAAAPAAAHPTATPAGTPAPLGLGAGGGAGELPAAAGAGPLNTVQLEIWFLAGPTSFSADQTFARRLERGLTPEGRLAYYIEYSEPGLNAYFDYWFGQAAEGQAQVRNLSIDLKPGGAIVYADVDLQIGWQRAGAVFMLDASGRQFVLTGVDLDGRFYSTPPEGRVAELAEWLQSEGNRALRDLAFIDPAGRLSIQALSLSEDSAQILAY